MINETAVITNPKTSTRISISLWPTVATGLGGGLRIAGRPGRLGALALGLGLARAEAFAVERLRCGVDLFKDKPTPANISIVLRT